MHNVLEVPTVALAHAGLQARMALLSKAEFRDFLKQLKTSYPIIGPVSKGKAHVFKVLEDVNELDLNYQTTILPPKKFFHQPIETLLLFGESGVEPAPEDSGARILVGIHPCDVNALLILDRAYSGKFADPYYLAKRQNTIIIALNCQEPAASCFCHSTSTGPDLKNGHDLLLTDFGNEFLVEVGTQRGEALISEFDFAPAPRVLMVEKENRLRDARRNFDNGFKLNGLLESTQLDDDSIWQELARKCLSCGSCTMVCPTCFCYTVYDKLELDIRTGQRQREWTSCMLLEYAAVALGANFRPDPGARIKQRMLHKFAYYEPQYGTIGCVGCGRCITSCPAKIDPRQVIEQLRGEI